MEKNIVLLFIEKSEQYIDNTILSIPSHIYL